MSANRFNAAISVVGMKEPKVQKAILLLLENQTFLKDTYDRKVRDLRTEVQQLRQKISGRS
ncbi:MAG: hypothetical protein ACI4RA_10625 [Kiritimatiellia bacterium]